MEYLWICITALLVSLFTLLSGFGLSTVLTPVFALFFPLPVAVASVAIIHLANNLFKGVIMGSYAHKETVIRFGIPAAFFSALGAYLLSFVSQVAPLTSYCLLERVFHVSWIGLLVGGVIVISSLFELIPTWSHLSFSRKYLPLGGVLSGFFGGVSGNQGMLRSAFLLKAGLTKQQFIGTGIFCSLLVDATRLLVYGWGPYSFAGHLQGTYGLIIAASLSAFVGAYLGAKYSEKVSFKVLQILIGAMLFVLGFGIAIGVI